MMMMMSLCRVSIMVSSRARAKRTQRKEEVSDYYDYNALRVGGVMRVLAYFQQKVLSYKFNVKISRYVFALVLQGYFGAKAVSSSRRKASRNSQNTLLGWLSEN